MAKRKPKRTEGAVDEAAPAHANAEEDAVTNVELQKRVDDLDRRVERQAEQIAIMMERLDEVSGVALKGACFDLAEFRAAVKGGRQLFVVASDCTHPALSIRKGADMRLSDYRQDLVEDLIGRGALKLLKNR